jgi:hypothetical protein
MAKPRESQLEGEIDRLAAAGDWLVAFALAAALLCECKAKADTRPQIYIPLVQRISAKIGRMAVDGAAAGALHSPLGSLLQAMAASGTAELTTEDKALVTQAHAAGILIGAGDYVRQFLDSFRAAMDDATGAERDGIDPQFEAHREAAQAASTDFQRLITRRRRRTRDVDDTTIWAEAAASATPMTPGRNLAARLARQSVLLHRYGCGAEAVTAAGWAAVLYGRRGDLTDEEKGLYATVLLRLAEDRLAHRDFEHAGRPVEVAMGFYHEYHRQSIPFGYLDLARVCITRVEVLAHTGHTELVEQAAEYAWTAAKCAEAFGGADMGKTGATPAMWGLPVVLSAKEWNSCLKRLSHLLDELGLQPNNRTM